MSFDGFSEAEISKLNSQNAKKVATISKTKEIPISPVNNNKRMPNKSKQPPKTEIVDSHNNERNKQEESNFNQVEVTNGTEVKVDSMPSSNPTETSPLDLKECETKQKIMEEQNRKRKELLAKALADRTQRTIEETEKLNLMRLELKSLDDILSTDVKILRKRIEDASVEYMQCQKQYDRIEKEFLQAKLQLHQKLEKKEMLTQHLYAIINTNEERKAQKLTELMAKLQIDIGNNEQQ